MTKDVIPCSYLLSRKDNKSEKKKPHVSQYLTLFTPAYFGISGTGGVSDISLGWGGLRFQFFLEMTCLGVIYHIQKDS